LTVSTAGTYTAVGESAAGCPGASNAVVVNVLNQFSIDISASASGFCPSETVTLSINTPGVLNIQWSLNGQPISGANGSTLQATAGGTYAVTGENANGCPGVSNDIIITAYATPTISIIPSGSSTICAGDDISLSLTTTGLQNIQWFRDGQAIGGATGTNITVNQGGTYTLTAESAEGCAATSNESIITVAPLPDLQITPTGPVNICTGDNAVLTLNPSGLQNIQWSRDGQPIGGATNSTLTVTTAGTYTAVGESAAGCPGASNAVVVNVLNQFSIDISASASGFCPSETVTLSINTPGVLNIQWSLNGQPISGANGSTLQATAGGTYAVTGENANGCPGVSNDIIITAYATPTISIIPSGSSTICAGDDISLSLTTTGLQNIQWFRDGQAIGGATGTSITVNQGGTYTLTAESAEGCAATSNESIITVAPLPDLQITPTGPVNICTGDNAVLTLNPSGLQNIQWSRDGQPIGGATSGTLTVSTAGTYTAVGESAAGCPGASNAVVVNVSSSFSIDISPSGPLSFCENSSTVLTIGNSGINNIIWSRNGSVIPNATATTLTVSQAGTYAATAVSSSGCPGSSNQVVVAVDPLPLVSIAALGSLSFCEGASLTLEAEVSGANPASYLWTLNGAPFDDVPVITVQQGGTYVLSVVSDQGCPGNQASVVVTVSPIPVIDLGPDRDACEGVTVLLDASTPGASYAWSTGASSASIQVGQAGNYAVTVTVNGCSATDDINISIQPAPQLELGDAFSICLGEEAVLDASSSDADSYLWNDGSTLATLSISEPGQYSVTATKGDCQASESITVGLTAEPPTLSLGADRELCIGDTILLQAQGSDILSYTWSDGSTASSLAVTASGVYSLVVTGACGQAEDQVEVEGVDCGCFVSVPSAFTPNGDGLNDLLRPLSPCEIEGLVFMVFNRWGEKVFESADISSGWNGVFRNQDQPHDAYIYYLSYLDTRSAEKKEYRGSVLLIR
jgi:gliding motility-associated-like protein